MSIIIQYFLSVSHSVDLTKSNEEVLTALRWSNRFMRVLNPGQFQQVWNFLNFPAKISPRMSVEGERGRRGARTHLALIPADRGHVQSHLSTQPRILAIPYFHRIWQMQNAPLPKLRFSYWWKIFVWQVINHRRNIWFDNCCCQRETFRTEKLTSISSPNFTPSGWVHNYYSFIRPSQEKVHEIVCSGVKCKSGVASLNSQTTNNLYRSCFTVPIQGNF